jgi:hypothetical protein
VTLPSRAVDRIRFVLPSGQGHVTRYCFSTYVNRGDWIRTSDFLLPKQVLCQAELRPVGVWCVHRHICMLPEMARK